MTPQLVCFITPPSPFLLDERVFPALGILKVAAVAEREGYRVEHLDLNGVENYEAAVAELCRKYEVAAEQPTFAMTATTPQMVGATKIRAVLRDYYPAAKVILGGPHPTLVHAATKHSERARKAMKQILGAYDVVVAGDGERAIRIAIEEDLKLIDADDPKSPLFLESKDLTEFPLAARYLVDMGSYHYQIDGVPVTPLIGQLGCPFGCNFCAGRDSAMLRRVRLRPTSAVIAEMRDLYKAYGYTGFMFFDDELNVNPKFMELLGAMDALQQELGVGFRCRGFVKAELFTEQQARMMRYVGFRRVMCGFESGSERILKNINKQATRADNTRAMMWSHKHGLEMKALMSIGHPGESERTVEETRRWLEEVRPSDFDITIITPYPGSPYYDRARDLGEGCWGFETNGDWLFMEDVDYTEVADFYKGVPGDYKSYVSTMGLSSEEIVKAREEVEVSIRGKLGIPFYQAGEAVRFEASMGQLPGSVYRRGAQDE